MNKTLINGLLLLGILGFLLIYFFTVTNLSDGIYTPAQQQYLAYNQNRNISQLPPTLNLITSDGIAAAAGMTTFMPGGESRVQAILHARYAEEQGVSVTLYDLEFHGHYLLTGPRDSTTTVELFFPFPSNLETLHEVHFLVDNLEPPDASYTTSGISWRTVLQNGETRQIDVSYKADGANSFAYGLSHNQRSQIEVVVTVAGLPGSQVPTSSLPATRQSVKGGTETFTWKYTGLIADRNIQLSLPTRLSFAQRIAQLRDEFVMLARLAPFLVGLFIACLAGLFSLNGTYFSSEGYLLTGLGLTLFYPFLTFMSGLIGIVPAAIITFVVVSALLFVFLGTALGLAKIWRPLGLLLAVFLGFFSLGMLMAWRGLSLTSGGLLLTGAFMLTYAHRPQRVEPDPASQPEPVTVTQADTIDPELVESLEPIATPIPTEAARPPVDAYCLHCGRALEETYDFCPGCGQGARTTCHCEQCGHLQYVPPHTEPMYCVHCGHLLP